MKITRRMTAAVATVGVLAGCGGIAGVTAVAAPVPAAAAVQETTSGWQQVGGGWVYMELYRDEAHTHLVDVLYAAPLAGERFTSPTGTCVMTGSAAPPWAC
jgi:hypothetical protein